MERPLEGKVAVVAGGTRADGSAGGEEDSFVVPLQNGRTS
jgi:hypothetical protein